MFVDDCVFFKGSLNPVFFVLTCERKKTGNPMIDELGSDDLKAEGKRLWLPGMWSVYVRCISLKVWFFLKKIPGVHVNERESSSSAHVGFEKAP